MNTNAITITTRTTTNLINFSLIILVAIIASAFMAMPAHAQITGPGVSGHQTFTLPEGRRLVAKVTKVVAAHLEGDELAFDIEKSDNPDVIADKLLAATYSPGFDSYAHLRTELKSGTRTILIIRTRSVAKNPAVQRQLYRPVQPTYTIPLT